MTTTADDSRAGCVLQFNIPVIKFIELRAWCDNHGSGNDLALPTGTSLQLTPVFHSFAEQFRDGRARVSGSVLAWILQHDIAPLIINPQVLFQEFGIFFDDGRIFLR